MPKFFIIKSPDSDFDGEFLLSLENICRITRDLEYMSKYEEGAYDEEGNRRIKSWNIYFHTKDEAIFGEEHVTQESFEKRWKQLQELE